MKFDIFDSSFTHLIHRKDIGINGSHVKVRVSMEGSNLTKRISGSVIVFSDT